MRNNTTWYATANNATLVGDVVRRAVHVRLATPLEHPEERADFRHPDLLAWVRQERPRLLAAALTVLRAWFVAGKPKADLPAFGSFEAWSDIVRSVCAWLDLPDPWADTKDGLRQSDQADALHAALIAGLQDLDPEGKGLTTGEIKRRLEADMADAKDDDRPPRFATFIDGLGATRNLVEEGKVNGHALGSRLRALKEKRKDGAWIASVWEAHSKVAVWRVLHEQAGGFAGDAGDAGTPTPPARKLSDATYMVNSTADILPHRPVAVPASPASPANANDESGACVAHETVPPPQPVPPVDTAKPPAAAPAIPLPEPTFIPATLYHPAMEELTI
jgi:hypothetical protein